MRLRPLLVVLTLSFSAALAAQAPSGKPPAGTRIVTQTRLVSLYSDLEAQLETAASKGDLSKLKSLLTDDFNQWAPSPPGEPMPVEDWVVAYRPSSFQFRNISVQGFEDVDVANFVLKQQGHLGAAEMDGDYFVVDVWKHEDGAPRLAIRYISPAPKASANPFTPSGKP